MTSCVLCAAAAAGAGWTDVAVTADVVWVDQFSHTPVLIAAAGPYHACPDCGTWLAGDRQGLPAGVLHMIAAALDVATTAGLADHQTRRALREELVGQAHALADCIR